MCGCPNQVEAIHSLIYMDSAHRYCTFPTDYIFGIFSYLSMNQMSRAMLFGTKKGEMITQTYREIYDAINASKEAKRQHALGGASL